MPKELRFYEWYFRHDFHSSLLRSESRYFPVREIQEGNTHTWVSHLDEETGSEGRLMGRRSCGQVTSKPQRALGE